MKRLSILLLTILVALSLELAACQPAAPEVVPTQAPATEAPAVTEVPATEVPATEAPATEAPTAKVALKITGAVTSEQAWTEAEVKAMKTLDVESTNSKGAKETYTGVLITDLLALAQPKADATKVVFVADDGYTGEISLAELKACADCILSFRSKGGFSSVLPNFPGNLQVKGVIEIQVK